MSDAPQQPERASVYVIAADGGPVKIGVAIDPENRLKQLQTGSPFRLRLAHVEAMEDLDAYAVERATHITLDARRWHGEWFAVCVEDAVSAIRRSVQDLTNRPVSVKPETISEEESINNQIAGQRQMQDKAMLRLPDGLRNIVKDLAARAGRSSNAEMVRAIEDWASRRQKEIAEKTKKQQGGTVLLKFVVDPDCPPERAAQLIEGYRMALEESGRKVRYDPENDIESCLWSDLPQAVQDAFRKDGDPAKRTPMVYFHGGDEMKPRFPLLEQERKTS